MGGRQVRRRSTGPELEGRRAEIRRLMLAGYTLSQLREYGERRGWTVSQVRNDYVFVSDEWLKQHEEEQQYARPQAIQRIRRDLVKMRESQESPPKKGKKGKALPPSEPVSFKEIASHEMLLARIEGTLRPVEVKVDVKASSRRALIDTINSMTPEDMDRLVAEQREIELRLRGR